MDKDETIKQLADALWMMTKLFVSVAGHGWTGKAIDNTENALMEASKSGWKPEEMRPN